MRRAAILGVIAATLGCGCGVDVGDGQPDDDVDGTGPTGDTPADDPSTPPLGTRTKASTAAWLATGEYLTWRCEDAPHASRPGSGHSKNRICNNESVAMTAPGTPFPVGAISVKELLDASDRIVGYAFMEKAGASDGGRGWYWYEVIGSTTYAASYGSSLCSGCHSGASHDFLFTVVR